MRNIPLFALIFLGCAAVASAQTPDGVTVSTDPAKAAAVEHQAQQLQAAQAGREAPAKHYVKRHVAKRHAAVPAKHVTKRSAKHQAKHAKVKPT